MDGRLENCRWANSVTGVIKQRRTILALATFLSPDPILMHPMGFWNSPVREFLTVDTRASKITLNEMAPGTSAALVRTSSILYGRQRALLCGADRGLVFTRTSRGSQSRAADALSIRIESKKSTRRSRARE